MKRLTSGTWFARLLALFFTILLFLNANNLTQPPKMNPAELTAVAENVPIKLNYDDSKYYIAGYEEGTKVYLSSNNKVLLDMQSHEQTRTFKLEADLTEFKEGSYEVPVEVKNLNRAVTATLSDEKIHVRIEKRETRVFKVKPKVNDNLLKNGYTLDDITIDPKEVEVTSGAETLDQIKEVVAPIEDDRDLSADLSKRVDLVALDFKGNVLGVIILPSVVTMTVHVQAPSKSVPLKIVQAGSIQKGIKEFEFETALDNVTIYGAREELEKVKSIEAYVDTTNISETQVERIALPVRQGIKVDPVQVDVTVKPIKSEKKSTGSSVKSAD